MTANVPMSRTEIEALLAEEAKALTTTFETRAIATKGRTFTLPDGTRNPGPLHATILGHIFVNKKYDGPYDPNNIKPPICWATSSEDNALAFPASGVPDPCGRSCEAIKDWDKMDKAKRDEEIKNGACPFAQWGSDGRGKACKNSIMLALISSVAADKGEDTPIYTLSLGSKTISRYKNLLAECKKLKKMPVQLQVDIAFDPNEDNAIFTFTIARVLDDITTAFSKRAEAQEILASAVDYTPKDA